MRTAQRGRQRTGRSNCAHLATARNGTCLLRHRVHDRDEGWEEWKGWQECHIRVKGPDNGRLDTTELSCPVLSSPLLSSLQVHAPQKPAWKVARTVQPFASRNGRLRVLVPNC